MEIPVARLPAGMWAKLPIIVVHGARTGKRMWLSAAIHGDEIGGVEIIRRVLELIDPATLRGTVVAVPVVNVFGFIEQSRYLPDRRDLNRSFPGSARGSLAGQLADLFMREVVGRCQYGIDLHTGSHHRTNLPQVRADLSDPETRRCARAFGAPVAIHARVRDGSLREAAARRGITALLYEGGEALRFDEAAISAGVRGILGVLRCLGMVPREAAGSLPAPIEVDASRWVRASQSGLASISADLGARCVRGDELAVITDVLGKRRVVVRAPVAGIVIGRTSNPMVNRGDALIHIAETSAIAGSRRPPGRSL